MSLTPKEGASDGEIKAQNKEENKPQSSTGKKETPQSNTVGSVLSTYGYMVGETLGEGSYAVVKAAYSKKLRRQTAIKIVTKKKAPVDYLRKFLPREIQVMKHMDHPNIVGLHEAVETSLRIYLILDFAQGGDLLDYIKNNRGPLGETESRRFFQQLVEGIEYIHERGVVHRDLKCENILLSNDKRVMISDFGFARVQPIQPETNKRLLSSTFCGSYAYAPPEILRGIAYDGARADIWSLGVVLYTMLCACLPFDDTNLKALFKQVAQPIVFHKDRPVSDEAKDLLRRMMCYDVSRRIAITEIKTHPWFLGKKLTDAPPEPTSQALVHQKDQTKGSKDSGFGGELNQDGHNPISPQRIAEEKNDSSS